MATKGPPVIAEIAKAYQNDPRTLLAKLAVEQGSSGAPVAQGKYAYGDGIARIAQALGGAMMNKGVERRYAADEAQLLGERKEMAARQGATVSASQPPAQMAQVAAALGAPAPVTAAPVPAAGPIAPPLAGMGAPPAAMPPSPRPGPPVAPPMPGGAPTGPGPFGPGASPLAPPTPEAVPEAPAAVARPTAPDAVGPTQDRTLKAALALMDGGNRYESNRAMDMYETGLGSQTKLDESATERRQRLADKGYDAELADYGDSRSQGRASSYAERREAQGRNFEAGENFKERGFRADESGKDRSQRTWEARFGAGTQFALQRSALAAAASEGDKDRQNRLDIKGMDRKDADLANKQANAAKYLGTKAGQAFLQKQTEAVQNASDTLSTLGAFEQRLGKTKKVGGVLIGNAPGMVRWANKDYQVLESLTNRLTLANSKDMKGSLSDKDIAFLSKMVPSIRNTRGATQAQIKFLRGVAQRQQDFAISQTEAVENGEGSNFMRDWAGYTSATSVENNVPFEQWRKSQPKFDKNGNPVK